MFARSNIMEATGFLGEFRIILLNIAFHEKVYLFIIYEIKIKVYY